MDPVTRAMVDLIESTDVTHRTDLLDTARLAFLDYIASLGAAEDYPAVQDLAHFVALQDGQFCTDDAVAAEDSVTALRNSATSCPNRALYYGFASHYLDFDDAQANLAGHFSIVIYSALLAVLESSDTWYDVLRAYIIGAELEGLIGGLINPHHRSQGWHSTGTVGVIGAAAAVGALRGVHGESLASLLSLAATQSCGMSFQSGSDGKPLHAGLAARNAVWTYELVAQTSLRGSLRPFNPDTGWFTIIADKAVTREAFTENWLRPGQIISPGLWMKLHPYCSAAMCGAEAAELLAHRFGTSSPYVSKHYNDSPDADEQGNTNPWANTYDDNHQGDIGGSTNVAAYDDAADDTYTPGNLWPYIESVTVHFPPGADKALKYTMPTTGREGQFSMEFVVWQILQYGSVQDQLFFAPTVPFEATQLMPRITRVNDLEPVSQAERITKITIHMTDGERFEATVSGPKGSPQHPLTIQDITKKLTLSIHATRVDSIVETFIQEDIHTFIRTLKGEGVLHV